MENTKPTLEDVKEYFKNAKSVMSIGGRKVKLKKLDNIVYSIWNNGVYYRLKQDMYGLWHKNYGFAEIVSYKKDPKPTTQILYLPISVTLINDTKWQEKRMYSEGKCIEAIQYTIDNFFNEKLTGLNAEEIFEQFKKK